MLFHFVTPFQCLNALYETIAYTWTAGDTKSVARIDNREEEV
jgi:hypothetical protein